MKHLWKVIAAIIILGLAFWGYKTIKGNLGPDTYYTGTDKLVSNVNDRILQSERLSALQFSKQETVTPAGGGTQLTDTMVSRAPETGLSGDEITTILTSQDQVIQGMQDTLVGGWKAGTTKPQVNAEAQEDNMNAGLQSITKTMLKGINDNKTALSSADCSTKLGDSYNKVVSDAPNLTDLEKQTLKTATDQLCSVK